MILRQAQDDRRRRVQDDRGGRLRFFDKLRMSGTLDTE